MPKPCAWPAGCWQWCATDERVCLYHAKVFSGLLEPTRGKSWVSEPREASRFIERSPDDILAALMEEWD